MWGHPNSLCFLYSVYKSDMSSLLGAKLTVAEGKTLVLVSFPSSLKLLPLGRSYRQRLENQYGGSRAFSNVVLPIIRNLREFSLHVNFAESCFALYDLPDARTFLHAYKQPFHQGHNFFFQIIPARGHSCGVSSLHMQKGPLGNSVLDTLPLT